ncbi:MAG: HIT domain-containing protein [Defluviitaleaceae bacterium]|nr:HIT domain-containing protein [Defluviitaleaceae bacterium]
MMEATCGICDIVKRYTEGDGDTAIVYDSEHFIAIHSPKPFAETHIFIAAKQHISTIFDLGNESGEVMIDMTKAIQTASEAVIALKGACKVEMYLGEFQNTQHLHCHVIYDAKEAQ